MMHVLQADGRREVELVDLIEQQQRPRSLGASSPCSQRTCRDRDGEDVDADADSLCAFDDIDPLGQRRAKGQHQPTRQLERAPANSSATPAAMDLLIRGQFGLSLFECSRSSQATARPYL